MLEDSGPGRHKSPESEDPGTGCSHGSCKSEGGKISEKISQNIVVIRIIFVYLYYKQKDNTMEKFIKFLEDNNAWENFERNFIEQGTDVKDYKRDCKTFERSHLTLAFTWSETKEGSKYWSRLDDKWRQESTPLKKQLLSDD